MKRRDFIKLSAVLGAASALPVWSTRLFAARFPALPIPPLLGADAQGQIALTIQAGKSVFKNGVATTTWGYNGSLLGPALRCKRGQQINLQLHNQLAESTTLHMHGLEIAGNVDGGPHGLMATGGRQVRQFTINQPASTCWFHPHTHQRTGQQVAMGLGGLVIIEDEASDKLALPKQWGVDDIPVILQDKRLNAEGQIDYKLDVMSAAVGWFGDLMLTNGAVYPQHIAPRGWLRLRLLNGCNARPLKLKTSDNRPMYVIASDGGFLAEPVSLTELALSMGERFEVLIETRDGKPFDLVTLPVQQMGMTLAPFDTALPVLHIEVSTNQGIQGIPENLVALPALPATNNLPQRQLQLSMDPRVDMLGMKALVEKYGQKAMAGMSMEEHLEMEAGDLMSHGDMKKGRSMAHDKMKGMEHGAMQANQPFNLLASSGINGQAFDMHKPLFDVKKGQYEKWLISGVGDTMLHPFHIHGTQFRILSENGKPPAKHRQGWKDTVNVENAVSEVLVQFNHLAPVEQPYMAHCHVLEHEDTGMMMSFTVNA